MEKIKALKKLGLTKQQAETYLLLLKEGPLEAKIIAEKLKMLPNAVYRILYYLNEIDLIEVSSKAPLVYSLTPIEYAINNLGANRKEELNNSMNDILSIKNIHTSNSELDIELTKDRIRFFKEAEELIKDSKSEVLIISIGEPATPAELILADKKAIERGVKIKVIYHRYNDINKTFVQNLIRNGLEIRHLKDWGYHLEVVDGEKCLLAVNNPENTDERVNIKFQSKYLSKVFRDYFYYLWEKAEPIEIE